MILRRVAAVILGVILAFAIVQLAEFLVHKMYPPPPGYNMRDMEQVKRYVATLATSAMLIVLLGQVAGALGGAFAAAKIGRSPIPAYVFGALLLVAGVASTFMIPQPLWFVVVELAAYIGATIAGAMFGAPQRPV